MEKKLNTKCTCPNKKCELWGNCSICKESHGGKYAYCQLGVFRKKLRKLGFMIMER
jgi:hypothetical protein